MGHQLPGRRAGGRFDIYVDSEGGGADKNSPWQDKSGFEAEHNSPTNQIPEGKKNHPLKKKRKFSRIIKKTPTPSSQQVQKITPNSPSRTSTRNRSSTKKKDGSGAKKDEEGVDDQPLANLNPTQIRQKAYDLLKVNERLVEKISKLKSMNSQLKRYLYDKAAELQFQESHNN